MGFCLYLKVELNRIFHSKTVKLIILLTMICPMSGYKIYKTTEFSTLSGDLIGNPCVAGALEGGILFAFLTLLEFNRVRKHQIGVLMDSIASPLIMNIVRLISLAIVAIVSVTVTTIAYFPYTFLKMRNIFSSYTYFNSFFLLMLPSILLSILVASAFYQIFYRVDLSMVAFITFMFISFSKWFDENNILHWIKPSVPELSDDFSNAMVFRLMQHNRLFWFLLLGGFWLIGLLCVRQYGKGLLWSIIRNLRKVYIPFLAVTLISNGCYAYKNQPYVYYEDSEVDDSEWINRQLELSNTDAEISFDTSKGSLSGKATYSLQNLSSSEQECKLRMRQGYTLHTIIVNGKKVLFKDSNISDARDITFILPDDKEIKVFIEYEGMPKIDKEFSDKLVDTTNISDKYIDLPSYKLFPGLRVAKSKDNTQITAKITMPDGLIPVVDPAQKVNDDLVANKTGDTVKLLSEDGNNKTWFIHVDGTSFSLMAGDYVMKKLGNQYMPIEFYYSSKFENNMKNMNAEKMMKDTVDYCTAHYGKLYNTSETSPLKIVQNTAFFNGGMALPNFSTMSETYFSDENLSDKSKGASRGEVLSHEITHQWWGPKCRDSGEALTVYTTYRVMKEKYGEEYVQKNYVDQWKKHIKDQNSNFYIRHPEYLDILPEKYATEILKGDRVIDQYSKKPLQILKASQLVGGEDNLDKILANLYKKIEKESIAWQDFLDACGLKEEDLNVDELI
ncbi:M1 family aminopeptidase [Clostridium sp. CTA-5]